MSNGGGAAQHRVAATPAQDASALAPVPLATVIVSRPGIMQQPLRTSLAACSSIAVAASLGDGLSALNYAVAHKPDLLVVDCNLLDDEVEALLTGVKQLQLTTRSLVLTRSHRQAAKALAHGAGSALPHDGSFQELQAVLAQVRTTRPAQT